jgi:hypothetical protein
MGSVHLVYDEQLETEVALKTLNLTSGADLYRFKREFRALADIKHPNLVTLYELVSEGPLWFFTMEYVPGCPSTRTWPWRSPMTDSDGTGQQPDPERVLRSVQQLCWRPCHARSRVHSSRPQTDQCAHHARGTGGHSGFRAGQAARERDDFGKRLLGNPGLHGTRTSAGKALPACG